MVCSKQFSHIISSLGANLEACLEGKLTAAERPVLTTKWVVEAQDRMKKQMDVIKHFVACKTMRIGTRIIL